MHPSKVTLRPKVRRPMAWDSTKSAPSAQQPEPSTQCPIPARDDDSVTDRIVCGPPLRPPLGGTTDKGLYVSYAPLSMAAFPAHVRCRSPLGEKSSTLGLPGRGSATVDILAGLANPFALLPGSSDFRRFGFRDLGPPHFRKS